MSMMTETKTAKRSIYVKKCQLMGTGSKLTDRLLSPQRREDEQMQTKRISTIDSIRSSPAPTPVYQDSPKQEELTQKKKEKREFYYEHSELTADHPPISPEQD
jgi:hypothetical protein